MERRSFRQPFKLTSCTLGTSLLQAPGLKAAKVGGAEESADLSMDGFPEVPQFPKVVRGTVPIDVATFGAAGSSAAVGAVWVSRAGGRRGMTAM